MNRLLSVLVLLGCAATARAHFVWLVPDEKAGTARAVFSDGLEPDRAALLKKVEHTQFFVQGADGKATTLKVAGGKVKKVELPEGLGALEVSVPGKGPRALAAFCNYGVLKKGKAEPFLLNYSARTFLGLPSADPVAVLTQPCEGLPLDVVLAIRGHEPEGLRVFWQGKPLAGATVSFHLPGKEEAVEATTDAAGLVKAPRPGGAGFVAVRAAHVEKKAGEQGGKKYAEVRHYATLTFRVGRAAAARAAEPSASPWATKLLSDARAARANWKNFPGFSADLEVNSEGKVTKGKVEVGPKGTVVVTLDGDLKDWARRNLASIVGHRMDGSAALNTPCAFADDVTDHPLGRAIRVLNDEFHSSYRIRDRQIIVVNRRQGPVRFTITVLENRTNAEGQFLPAHYVVNTWDVKSGALKSSITHHQTWRRVGAYDLPVLAMTVTATEGKQEARTIRLSNHRLRKGRAGR